jgi:hypothetical protein
VPEKKKTTPITGCHCRQGTLPVPVVFFETYLKFTYLYITLQKGKINQKHTPLLYKELKTLSLFQSSLSGFFNSLKRRCKMPIKNSSTVVQHSSKVVQKFHITRHAWNQFRRRYRNLYGTYPAFNTLIQLLHQAKRETHQHKATRWHAFCRQIVHGQAQYLVANGWRFIVSPNGVVITVERVNPSENYVNYQKEEVI